MDKRVRMAYDIIRRDFRSPLNLAEVAERVGLSPFHFHRLFKEALGQTPRELLNETRLQRAAHQLVIGNYQSLTALSLDCGFNSLSSFSRAFSAHYGTAPGKFVDSITLYRPHRAHSMDDLQVEVSYQPATQIIYSLTEMEDKKLIRAFEQTASYCSYHNLEVEQEPIGVITHEVGLRGMCYYAGLRTKGPMGPAQKEKLFTIAEGYYASFFIAMPAYELWDFLINWKTGWLDKSPYDLAEPMAYELVDTQTGNDAKGGLKRKISIPVKRRAARMAK